ncbi:SurA N-terminal domain-containing protein [Oceanobacillus halophilus]|uniref:Peptidylprolyl isomerase n=1 Tax=Oceanobacillus halophilus TaxID=930130 RepID=A0A495A2J6_9BACI|nr:SurA N-terminal domain-containing protein [Oceanobacillus halophilus]RKQ33176.1 hypothetical protein D8M06_10375 [Oceanobacillus halophilus]
MRKLIIYTVIVTIGMIFAACNNETLEENTEQTLSEQEPLEFSDEERVEEETTVATVNGQEIKGRKYNSIYTQIKSMMYQYGQDVSDAENIKEQTIAILVNQELIMQDAGKVGVHVTEEEAGEELQRIKEKQGDQFKELLQQFDLKEEDYRVLLKDDLITSKYIEQEIKVEVTEEEMKARYDELKERDKEIGDFTEIKDQIKSVLEGEKKNKEYQVKVTKLKEKAEVETSI